MKPGEHPVDRIVWRPVKELRTNGWNPNVVHVPERRLLETSLIEQGWVQPILVNPAGLIIDGENRCYIARTSKALKARDLGMVPCAIIDLTDAQAMLLTVRINRAKGTHVAVKMSDLVQRVIAEGIPREEVARLMGASLEEVDLLYQDDLFLTRKLDEVPYSRAWYPAEGPSRTGVG